MRGTRGTSHSGNKVDDSVSHGLQDSGVKGGAVPALHLMDAVSDEASLMYESY